MMVDGKTPPDSDGLEQFKATVRRERELKEQTYRERALRMFPWVCARCGREFSGRKLRELTVHHRDHNHDNNPPDGSNWELLCVYCHDNEHARYTDAQGLDEMATGRERRPTTTHQPFAALADLCKDKK